MKPFSAHPIVKDGFSVAARHEGSAVFVKISGSGDVEAPVALGTFLRKVHGEAVRLRARSVIVECDELYFMSSACAKCLATWIEGLVELDSAERYEVHFRANPALPWQRRSFESLERTAPSLVHVDSGSVQTRSAGPAPAALQSTKMSIPAIAPVSGTVRLSPAIPQSGTVAQAGKVAETPAARRKT
jgi:hypothetical protein